MLTESQEASSTELGVSDATSSETELQESDASIDTETKTEGEAASIEDVVGESITEASEGLSGEEELKAAQEPKKTPRADKRIQELVRRNKELTEGISQRDIYYQQQLQALSTQLEKSRQGTETAFQQQQLEIQRKQLEIMQGRREEEATLSPMEKFKREILREAQSSANPELDALKSKLAALEAASQKANEEATRRARFDYYTKQTRKAAEEVVFQGLPKETSAKLGNETEEMLLAYCGAFGLEPKEAAPRFRKFLENYHVARLNGKAAQGTQLVKTGQAVSKTVATGQRPAQSKNKFPAMANLRKAGYDSHLDWISAGEPQV